MRPVRDRYVVVLGSEVQAQSWEVRWMRPAMRGMRAEMSETWAPVSRRSTETVGSSARRAARVAPAGPEPTTMKS